MKLLSYALFLFAIVVALALGSENGHLVDINLLIVKKQVSVSLLMFLSFLVGATSALLFLAIRKMVRPKNA